MKQSHFKSELLEGHKGTALEVPFDPKERWSVPARALWPGGRGHPVRGLVNGERFESVVVPGSPPAMRPMSPWSSAVQRLRG